MSRTKRGLRRLAVLLGALGFVVAVAGAPPTTVAADPPLAAWDGSVDLYRDGVFTTQKSWLWCTAAGVQIVRNIVDDQEDHTVSAQRRYFTWMREHNRYTLPLSAGVDPQGWTAGLRHFVDDRYRLVTSTTFENALRSAVKRLRLTGLPVALTVAHGNHGWILTGFAATADPAVTASFKVTSVRIVGPLYGLQSRNGYDMPPDTKLTPTQLKRYFTPWKYAPKAMIWDGRYVSIQPIPTAAVVSPAASEGPATAAEVSPPAPATSTEPSGTKAEPPRTATDDSGAAEAIPPAAMTTDQPARPDAAVTAFAPDVSRTVAVAVLVASAGLVAVVLARVAHNPGPRRGPSRLRRGPSGFARGAAPSGFARPASCDDRGACLTAGP